MKVGDLIRIRKGVKEELQITSDIGVILDIYEDMNTTHYQVQFLRERGWFDGFMLEVVSDAK
jgi:hypothetical protein|tara:strand:- start:254 stop:439 length:186 start_codon:yes stop_codon:yes gene_type:complete